MAAIGNSSITVTDSLPYQILKILSNGLGSEITLNRQADMAQAYT